MKKNINRVMLLNILSVVLLQGLSLISSPLFSRLLGTDGYGNLTSFSVWASVACTIFSLQTGTTIANARVEYPEEQQQAYQSSVLLLSLLAFAAAGAVCLILIRPICGFLRVSPLIVLLIYIQALGSFLVGFLNSKFTYEFAAGRNLLLSVGIAVSTFLLELLLVLNMPRENRFLGRIVGNAVVYGLVGAAAALWILKKGRGRVNRSYWRFCLTLSVPLIFQSLSYQLLGNSDIMMLKQMRGASDAGVYSLALTFSTLLFTIFTALNGSWIPFFFDDMKEAAYDRAAARARNFMELFTVLCVGFVLLVREVYHIYASEEYWDGTVLIPLFAAGFYINFLNTFPVTFETFHKKTDVVAAATIAAALINLALNYILIRMIGIAGAAVATALSHGIQFAMHECYVRFIMKDRPDPVRPFTWLPWLLAYCAAAAAFYLLPSQWLLRWSAGACIGLWELWRIWKRKVLI